MKDSASAYAKIALVVAAIFVGIPLVAYALFSATQGAWNLAEEAVSSSKGSVASPSAGSSFGGLKFLAGTSKAKKIERKANTTVKWVKVFGVAMAVFVIVTAAGLQAGFRKGLRKKGEEGKHRRRRRVRVRV